VSNVGVHMKPILLYSSGLLFLFLFFKGPHGVPGLKGGRGTQGPPVSWFDICGIVQR
jgi:hypothetical protein